MRNPIEMGMVGIVIGKGWSNVIWGMNENELFKNEQEYVLYIFTNSMITIYEGFE